VSFLLSNHVAAQLITLGSRPAVHSDSKVPSCGNQPAHIRLDTRRYDTLDAPEESSGQRSPAHLTK
jgi:hypothetical protein